MSTRNDTEVVPVQESIWHCYAIASGEKKSKPVDRSEIPNLLEDGTRFWIDIEAASKDDVKWLGELFGFHDLALIDVLNNNVRPKQEAYDDVLFTVLGAINLNEGKDQLDTINLNIFLTDQYIVSVHHAPLKTLRKCIAAMQRPRDPLKRGTDHLYHMLLDGVVDRYLDIIDEVDVHLAQLEQDVFDAPTRTIQEEIFQEKRRLAYLKRSITPKRDAMRSLVYDDIPQISPEVRLLIRDVYDHVLRVVDAIESYRELTNGLMDSYMSNLSHRMNEVMKLMSIIATIMLPLSFLTGIFGMNFEVIPGIHFQNGFWLLVVVMVALAGLILWFFRRNNIL